MPIALPPLPEDTVTRQKLGEYWLHNARMEHASIGAFARLSLELLSVGAPPDLLRQSASAQSDEIHHAEICFSLASHYLEEDVSPGVYPGIISGGLRRVSLAELARESFVDGAIGEGIACRVAEGQSALAEDEKLSTIYDTIARDEGKHAKLGWDIVEWALTTEDEKEKVRIEKSLSKTLDMLDLQSEIRVSRYEAGYLDGMLSVYGLIDIDNYQSLARSTRDRARDRLCSMITRYESKGFFRSIFDRKER